MSHKYPITISSWTLGDQCTFEERVAAAKAAGQSVQAYVLQACEERMKREGRPLELDSPADE